MNVEDKLSKIVNEIDGAYEGVFSTYDGVAVSKYVLKNVSSIDSEMICANLASVLNILKKTDFELKDVIVTFTENTIIIKTLEDGYLCIILDKNGNLGRAKLELSKLSKGFVQ